MKRALAILLLLSLVFSEFKLENVEVVVNNIDKEGGARITEHIRFFVIGTYEQEKYKTGLSKNDLSNWADLTGLSEVKMHISAASVNIKGFSLRPQTLTKCDPFLDLCHGELILSYDAYPYFNKTTNEATKGTGLFNVETYKPRTTKYALNMNALDFRKPQSVQKNDSAVTATSENVMILDKNVVFTVILPQNTVILDLSQSPANTEITPPTASASELSWTNTILGQFVLVFEVEESLDKEVVGFFSDVPKRVQEIIFGNQGLATVLIITIIVGSFVYLKSIEKKG